jgi:flagellar biosynthetic protein FlhB
LAEESDLERTEPASARRLEQAREEGNVPHSRELMAFMVLAAGATSFWLLGGWIAQRAGDLLRRGLSFGRNAAFDTAAMREDALGLSVDALLFASPVFLAVLAAVFAVPSLLGSWTLSAKALQPDLMRMDPLKGLGRMFSRQSLAELVKALLKALLIAVLLWWLVRHEQDRLFSLISQPVEVGLATFSGVLFFSFVALVGGLALIAAIDVPFQLWQYHDRLKMTREELKREHRESEGDPQLKARIRSQQREIARGRMMAEVPKADVVVTNPTHFAVALRYDAERMAAPQVVAKGMNLVADRIRELAGEHRVPLLEAPALARALHRHADVGDPVPASLYTAVAEVMAWVFQVRAHASTPGELAPPQAPLAIAVPAGLDPGAVA